MAFSMAPRNHAPDQSPTAQAGVLEVERFAEGFRFVTDVGLKKS